MTIGIAEVINFTLTVITFYYFLETKKLRSISEDNLNFQIALTKNKQELIYIDDALKYINELNRIVKVNPLDQSHADFNSCDVLLSQIKISLNLLSSFKNKTPDFSDVINMGDIYKLTGDNPLYLNDIMNQLKKLRESLLA